jgi:hypothetical protein
MVLSLDHLLFRRFRLMNDHNIESIDYYESDVLPSIRDKSIVPVISNSFRLGEIFGNDAELKLMLNHNPEFYDEVTNIDQQLTKAWAASKEYPMSDDHNLARVAQYLKVVLDEPFMAKTEYLKFLSQRLLKNNQGRAGYEGVVERYQKGAHTSFTKMVSEFDLPATFSMGREDPLLSLARLPIPIYITTSYFSFLEEALIKAGKRPSTQVLSGDTKFKMEREYVPDVPTPVVYHLFGLEDYPKSLVLSEDDYMEFLMNSASAISSLDVFPQPLRDALSQSRLLLLGYHLQSWDFRALFRFIHQFRKRPDPDTPRSIALQLLHDLENKDFEKKSLSYLESYFTGYRFKVKWIDPENFLYGLSDAWQSRG